MRVTRFVVAAVCLAVATGCTQDVQRRDGDAAPAGSPGRTTAAPVSSTPSNPAASTAPPQSAGRPSGIRGTDWKNVTLTQLLGLGDVTFRDGQAHVGANNCTMLPGGAQPAYGEFLTEEPANAPVTEDALVLVECTGDYPDQHLIPVQVNGSRRSAYGSIDADVPAGPNARMTFTSYRLEAQTIVTVVRKADGSTETRRYVFAGGNKWRRL
jgi:hypothetical protein